MFVFVRLCLVRFVLKQLVSNHKRKTPLVGIYSSSAARVLASLSWRRRARYPFPRLPLFSFRYPPLLAPPCGTPQLAHSLIQVLCFRCGILNLETRVPARPRDEDRGNRPRALPRRRGGPRDHPPAPGALLRAVRGDFVLGRRIHGQQQHQRHKQHRYFQACRGATTVRGPRGTAVHARLRA